MYQLALGYAAFSSAGVQAISCIPIWLSFPKVEEIFGMPCYVDNESNLCAISVLQAYPDMNGLLYMHISQGVGIGIITNGVLLSGYDGYAAEIAHLPITIYLRFKARQPAVSFSASLPKLLE